MKKEQIIWQMFRQKAMAKLPIKECLDIVSNNGLNKNKSLREYGEELTNIINWNNWKDAIQYLSRRWHM